MKKLNRPSGSAALTQDDIKALSTVVNHYELIEGMFSPEELAAYNESLRRAKHAIANAKEIKRSYDALRKHSISQTRTISSMRMELAAYRQQIANLNETYSKFHRGDN